MEKTSFGERLKKAFGGARQVEIARKLGVSESAVKNYVAGRVPDAEKLKQIANLTNCSLHWLLTGEGSQIVTASDGLSVSHKLHEKLRTIAREQSQPVFGDADIAGSNVEARTLELLTEFLLVQALAEYDLVEEVDYLSTADRKLAARLTFASNADKTLDEQIRKLVRQEKGVSHVAQDEALRDIIRDIVREETDSRKRLVLPLDVGEKQQETRKAG